MFKKEKVLAFSKTGMFFVLLVFLFGIILPQVAIATIYQPGDTLEPDCAPGSVNCGVVAPATAGANANITSLTGLSTPLSSGQGGTGISSYTTGDLLYALNATTVAKLAIGTNGQVLKVSGGALVWQDEQTTITGNAGTATALQTARTIGGVSFDGTANITVASATGAFAVTGALAANGGITFDNATDTVGAFTLAGTLDANTNIITNIGNAATDFNTNGGLTLAENLTIQGTTGLTFNTGAGGDITFANSESISNDINNQININVGATGTLLVTSTTSSTIANSAGTLTLDSVGGTVAIASADQLLASSAGVEFAESDTNPACASGNYTIYADTSEAKLKKCVNGVATDLDTNSTADVIFRSKSANQSVTSSTVLVDETALQFTIPANEEWNVIWDLEVTNNNDAGPDWKSAVVNAGSTCTATLTGIEPLGTSFLQATTTDCIEAPGDLINNGITQDGSIPFQVYMYANITGDATSDVVKMQFAQDTSDTTALTILAGSTMTAYRVTGADLAESYYTTDSTIVAGDVVSMDSTINSGVKKTSKAYDSQAIGIISTKPGLVLGDSSNVTDRPVFVALSGRVPVKVVTENGAIEPGDYLTSSSTTGVAMKSNGTGPVIGQAMSAYDGDGIGVVMVFVKNFDLGGEIGEVAVLMGDISPAVNADGSDNGLSTLVTTIQSENTHNPVAIIAQKITDGKRFLSNFVAARVTAIRGYFDEVFARKIHTDQICVKNSDGSEVCMDGDQINKLLQNANVAPATPDQAQETPLGSPSSSDSSESMATPTPLISPEETPATPTPETTPLTPDESEQAESTTEPDPTQIPIPEEKDPDPSPELPSV